jgi:hypothetical protein
MSDFKVGDKAVCVDGDGWLEDEGVYTIKKTHSIKDRTYVNLEEDKFCWCSKRFKKLEEDKSNNELKTAKEWFQKLREPERSQAIANSKDGSTCECESLENALMVCFNWSSSPQGQNYWRDIRIRVGNGSYFKQEESKLEQEEKADEADDSKLTRNEAYWLLDILEEKAKQLLEEEDWDTLFDLLVLRKKIVRKFIMNHYGSQET